MAPQGAQLHEPLSHAHMVSDPLRSNAKSARSDDKPPTVCVGGAKDTETRADAWEDNSTPCEPGVPAWERAESSTSSADAGDGIDGARADAVSTTHKTWESN